MCSHQHVPAAHEGPGLHAACVLCYILHSLLLASHSFDARLHCGVVAARTADIRAS